MEFKTTYALLLSLVVITGAVTTDAFAQSNTERLADIDDNTDAIKSMVESLEAAVDSLADSVASILDMLTSMDGKLDNVGTSVTSVSSAVTDLSTKTSGIETSVSGMSTTLTDVQGKVDSINSAITSFSDVQTSIMLLTAKVDNLGTSLTDNGVASNVAANTEAINTLSAQVIANDASIRDALNNIQSSLSTIEASLGVVSEKVDRPVTTTTTADGTYIETDTDKKVTTYDFARLGKEVKDGAFTYYDLNLSFTCTEDVRLRSAEVIQAVSDTSQYLDRGATYDEGDAPVTSIPTANYPYGGSVTDPDRGVNYVKVEGTNLYNNWYYLNRIDTQEYNNDEAFNTRLLRAGDSLPFEARIYDGVFVMANKTSTATTFDADADRTGGTINVAGGDANLGQILEVPAVGTDAEINTVYRAVADGATTDLVIHADFRDTLIKKDRKMAQDLYTIQVDWVSIKSGTQCSLNFGTGGSAIGFSNSISEIFTVNILDDKATLKKFDTTLDCAGNPVRITEVKATPVGEWSDDFATLANLYLTIQDGVNDDKPDVHYRYVADGTVTAQGDYDDLPPSYGNAELRLHGDIPPQISNLVISLKMDTIPDVECTHRATS